MNATRLDDRGVIEACPQCGQQNRIPFASLGNLVRCGHCRTELPRLASAIEIDEEETFESLTDASSLPVLVDFWADWCGPCKMMAPELKRVAAHSAGKYVIAKVNTEGLPALAQRHHISALPTLVLFAGGRERMRVEGARPAVEIQRFVEQALKQG
jgi:thioredoxin 2